MALVTAHAEPCENTTFDLPFHTKLAESIGGSPTVTTGIMFDLDGTKSLLQKLNCGEYHLRMRRVAEDKNKLINTEVSILTETVELYKEALESSETEKDRIFDKWQADNKRMHEAESKVDYSWIGWATAAVLATTTVSFGVAFVLK